jgi:Ca2+-binding RTX toxin-like protein
MAILQIIGTGAGDLLRATNGAPTELYGDLAPTATQAQIDAGLFGNDTLIGASGNDTLFGQKGTDSLIGSGNDDLRGGAGQDTLVGTGADTLFGNKDADQLFGGISAFGGQGNDTIFGSTTGRGELGNDIIYGGTTLIGGNGNDTLVAASGSQTMTGNESSEDEFNEDEFVFAPATTLTIAGQTITQGGFGGVDTITDFQSGPGTGDVIRILNLDSGATVSVAQTGADVTITVAGTTSPDQGSPVPTSTVGSVTNGTNQSAAQTIVVRNANVQQLLAVGSNDIIVNDNTVLNTGNAVGISVNGVFSFNFTAGDRLGRNIDASSVNGVTLTANASNFQLNGVPQFTSVNNDTVLGSSNNDTIDGLAGNDSITGGGGNDSITGGLGNDTINGGTGFVSLPRIGAFVVNAELPAGSDSLFGNAGDDVIFGEGADSLSATNTATTFSSGNTDDFIAGGEGNDTLSGDVGADTLIGELGNDSLSGGTGNDYLNGGAGNDVLVDVNEFVSVATLASLYTDSANPVAVTSLNAVITGLDPALSTLTGIIAGGAFVVPAPIPAPFIGLNAIFTPPATNVVPPLGVATGIPFFYTRLFQDVLLGGDGNDIASSGSGNDLIEGGTGSDNLDGGFDNDLLIGGTGNDFITGGQGSDTISGGPDADALDGGGDNPNGFDYVYYADSAGPINVNLAIGAAVNRGGAGDAPAPGDTLNGFEGVIGSNFDDIIVGNSDNNVLVGLSGNDVVNGLEGRDYLNGGDGNDTLDGGPGIDTLIGGDGADVLINTPGDFLAGGNGDDLYVISGNVLPGETTARPENRTTIVENPLEGTSDQIRLVGGTAGFSNIVDLTNINTTNIEIIDINGQAAIINATDFAKVINFGTGAVTIVGSSFTPITFNASFAVNFTGGSGADVLNGSAGDDTFAGADGNDSVTGNAGNDVLSGGTGADTLTGGVGRDTLTGGSNTDVFVYTTLGDSAGTANFDTITDFNAGTNFPAPAVDANIDRFRVSILPPVLSLAPNGSIANLGLLGAATDTIDQVYLAAAAAALVAPPLALPGAAFTFSTFGGLLSGQFLIINDSNPLITTADALIQLQSVTGNGTNAPIPLLPIPGFGGAIPSPISINNFTLTN